MNVLDFTPLVFVAAFFAGFLDSLTGLGGGIVVTPVLTILFHVDIRYAIGASLVSVIATSSGAAAAYVRDGYSNIRIGMLLEIATVSGALVVAFLGTRIPVAWLSAVFGLILLQSAWVASREPQADEHPLRADPLGHKLKLNSSYRDATGVQQAYVVHRVKTGFVLMFGAGTISGLPGIGSGSLKVSRWQAMRIPFKVSTATSNFMIGVTAAASASIYLSRGYVNPAIAMPVMLGVLGGSIVGARFLARLPVKVLRRVFAIVVAVMAIEMILKGARGA